jgi:hypothetical protein
MKTIIEGTKDTDLVLKWPDCEHPRTPANSIILDGTNECCRTCQELKARRPDLRRQPVALKANLAERIRHFITDDGNHWHWSGRTRTDDGSAIIEYSGKIISVAKHLWEERNGSLKPQHRLYRTCSFEDCVYADCREQRPYTASLERARRPVEDIGQRTRAQFTAAILAATRREGTHLLAAGGLRAVRVRNRELDLRDLVWRHSGRRRYGHKPLITFCGVPDCIEPAHEGEGLPNVLAMLRCVDSHLIIPAEMSREFAKRIAWEAEGEVLPEGKTLLTLCLREDCAEPVHQTRWDCGKSMPTARRASLREELGLQQNEDRPTGSHASSREASHKVQVRVKR